MEPLVVLKINYLSRILVWFNLLDTFIKIQTMTSINVDRKKLISPDFDRNFLVGVVEKIVMICF